MKTEIDANKESSRPLPIREVVTEFQTGCKANFKQAGNYKIYPRHTISLYIKLTKKGRELLRGNQISHASDYFLRNQCEVVFLEKRKDK